MKILFTTALIIIFFSLIAAQTTNWFPLSVGNRWQYLYYEYYHANHVGTFESLYLRSNYVDRDTLIGNTKYFSYDQQWVRFTNNKIYVLNNGTDSLYMDFDLQAGTAFNSYYKGHSDSVVVIEGTFNLLGRNVPYKGFTGNGESSKFVNNFGLAYYDSSYSQPIPWEISDDQEYSFILSLIKDSTGNFICTKGNVKPTFITNPIMYASSSSFSWAATVTHNYSHVYNWASLNFVDTVYFRSFYSYRDSLFTNTTTVVVPPGPSNYYLPTAVLDTNLLKSGWIFRYNLIATDKCFVPDTGSTPDTGYYSCLWYGPTSITDKNIIPLDFSLYQNYPNPFNPNTLISYSIPSGSNIKLIIYNTVGQTIKILENGYKNAGKYSINFSASDLPSGIYFYKLEAGLFSQVKKMILLK